MFKLRDDTNIGTLQERRKARS